ncbi:MAG TPA: hypothetical protein VFA18_18145, partial [Gemmataceae bacterium]|nr:hypothetical protein [Gemmataceae bacterium]
PDSKRLAATVEFSGLCVFDIATRQLLWQHNVQAAGALGSDTGLDFSPDGKYLAAAWAVKKPIYLFEPNTGKVIRIFQGPVVGAGPLLFTADGKRLISGSWSGKHGVIWDVSAGKVTGGLQPEPGWLLDIARSPDGKTLALAGSRSIQLFDLRTGRLRPQAAHGHQAQVDHIDIFPDGRTVLTGSYWDEASGARLWNLPGERMLHALDRQAAAVAVSPDQKWMAASFYQGQPIIVATTTAQVIRTCKGPARFVDSLAITRDGRTLIGAGWLGNQLYTWNTSTGAELPPMGMLPQGGSVKHLALSPDGTQLATAGLDKLIRLWDVGGRKQIGQLTGMQGPVMATSWSPDGQEIAAVSAQSHFDFSAGKADPHLRVWDVKTGVQRQILMGSARGSWCVTWAPDGRLIAAGGEDNIIRVWERLSGETRFQLRGHGGPVTALAFTPNGRLLLSGSSDTTVLVWDVVRPDKDCQPVQAKDLPVLWQTLAGNARQADQAIRQLTAVAHQAIGLFRKRLHAAVAPDTNRIPQLVSDLDSKHFATREKASRELEAFGELALPALRKTLHDSPSAEVHKRAAAILERWINGRPSAERLRVARAVEILERIGTPDARRLLREWAGGAPEATLTQEARFALRRLEGHLVGSESSR